MEQNLGKMIRKAIAPELEKQKFAKNAVICRVRQKSKIYDTTTGLVTGEEDLLFDVEPLNALGYIDKDYLLMTPEEQNISKNNWIYRVTSTANPNVQKGSNDEGIFFIPVIESIVVISWVNDVNAFISLTSAIDNIQIKSIGGNAINVRVDELTKEKVTEILGSDTVKITTGDPNLNDGVNIQVTKDNYIINKDENAITLEADGIEFLAKASPYGGFTQMKLNGEGSFSLNTAYLSSVTDGKDVYMDVKDKMYIGSSDQTMSIYSILGGIRLVLESMNNILQSYDPIIVSSGGTTQIPAITENKGRTQDIFQQINTIFIGTYE